METTLFGLLLFVVIAGAQSDLNNKLDFDHYIDPFDSNPRFIVKDGHLIVITGRNKDLVFRSSGLGSIKINGQDIALLKQTTGSGKFGNGELSDSRAISDLRTNELAYRLQLQMDKLNNTIRAWRISSSLKKLRYLNRRLARLERLLVKNECLSNPCQNGATCEDGFDRYVCRCTEGFKGVNCEQDVNECLHYQGTELGCQNGATCLNTFGGYHCLCPPNFQGVRCTIEFNDCRNTSNHEICGNGVCFDLPRTQNGVARYRCVCYQGFTKSTLNSDSAPCDVDIDECATGLHRCSKNPPVTCINTREGYTCGPCPTGYSGDGYTCVPVDLCLVNNGGCSTLPRVSCFSSGSQVVCGSCPPGFVGDGTVCNQADSDICSANNGGCSLYATCRANPAISSTYRDCICRSGYSGNGIGTYGCQPSQTPSLNNMCSDSKPCLNGGTCRRSLQNSANGICMCRTSFEGFFCERAVNACSSLNPCQNQGICVSTGINSYSCICRSQYYGRNCEQARSLCGGTLDAEAGVLAYPITNGSKYANNVSCDWIIRNSNARGKVLNITFTRLDIEVSTRCLFDFVEIFDGPSREYKNLGRFCGHQLPNKNGIIISTFNEVLVHFRSDVSAAFDGFELNWITVEPKCGGLLVNLTHGVIESPGFPHHYPNKLDCYWDIVADYGKRIQFVFTHLDLEESRNCSFDYIEFRDGLSNSPNQGEQLARYCTWTASPQYSVPPPLTSSGSLAQIRFHSDGGFSAKGFKLLFHQVPGVCGGLLTGSSGTFQPPSVSYTSAVTGRTSLIYPNNVICDWLIRVLPQERISLRFLSFALESNMQGNIRFNRPQTGLREQNRTRLLSNCMFDYVAVYDGNSDNAPLRARLCGRIRPPEIVSTGPYLRVVFRSDASISARGFTALYKALCGFEYDKMEGVLTSPNFPAPVMTSKNCTYVLRVPNGYVLRLDIEQMDIEYDHRCLWDYLLIEDRRFCGDLPPPPIFSMTNEMVITYVNDETKPSKGFRARYRAIEIGCGGTFKQGDPPIAITPDNIINSAPLHQCMWEIRANRSYVVMIKFQHPEVPVQKSLSLPCVFNSTYIMVNDSDGSLIKRFCVDRLPPPITSSGRKLFITYVFRPPPPPSAQVVALTTKMPLLSNNSTPKVTSSSRLRNNTTLPTITTTTVDYETLINHVMSSINTGKSFYANYFFVKERLVCGRNLFANNGFITSPGNSFQYLPNKNCTWIIHVDNGLQIRLNFLFFQLEPESQINGQCYDYLEIRNGRRSDSPLIGKFCGNGPLPNIVSHSNYLFLRFVSDSSMQNRGFKLRYEATDTGCGGLLTAESGTIESPDYPNYYFSNMNCEWRIRVSEGSVVTLYVADIDIETPVNDKCRYDYLEFFDGPNDGSRSFGRYCSKSGKHAANIVTTSSNQMFIRFTTDATVNHGGFRLNYRTECNRTLTGRYGVIESPNYPLSHPHNLNCNWHLLAPMGNNITITFSALNLEQGIDCIFDHVNISEVQRHRQLSINMANKINSSGTVNITTKATLCGNYFGQLPTFKLTTNEAIVNFISDDSRSVDSYFRLEWAAVGCGGEFINRQDGYISSPNFPNPYPRNLECLWHIKAPDGNRVDLIIHTLDLEYSNNCIFDYLQVLGGPDEKSPEISRLCNQVSQVHVSSIGSYMTVKLVSDMSMSRRGFMANFETTEKGCGGLYTSDQGTITSPNYGRDNQYDVDSDCSYKIKLNKNFDIELTINDVQIPDMSASCNNSYLAIYDAANGDSENKLVTRLCDGTMSATSKKVLRSSDSVFFLRFKADGVKSGRGFNVTYKRVCGKTITVSDQDNFKVITSPSMHQLHSPLSDQCNFIIKASKPTDTITFRFAHLDTIKLPFALSGRPANECVVSYVELYEGDKPLPHKRIDRLCPDAVPPPIISLGDTILLVTHYSIFRAIVSTVKSFCGGDFTAQEGYITNPGYPNNYPLNIECIWVLQTAPGNRYVIQLEQFDIEDSDYCNGDYLEIRRRNSSGVLIGGRRLCGNKDNLPEMDFSFSDNVWIKFRSDETGVATGFMLHFQTASTVMLGGDSGELYSPGYPNMFHISNRTFSYTIAVSSQRYVKLDFVEMDLMGDLNHCSSMLAIYNGFLDLNQMQLSPTGSNQLTALNNIMGTLSVTLPEPKATYCSSHLPNPFVSDNNVVTVVYTSSNPYTSGKFRLRWSALNQTEYNAFDIHSGGVPTNVNNTFSVFVEKGQTFTLLHDNYTEYGNDINWYFQTRTSMHFNLSVELLSFHPATSCWFNKFTIYQWFDTPVRQWSMIKNLCNGHSIQMELPRTSLIRLHMQHAKNHDKINEVKARYNMTIYPICGGNFTQPSGVISSDDVKDGHGSTKCQWLIKVRPGRTVQITIEHYSIGSSINQCSQGNYLIIRNGHLQDSPLLTSVMCGTNTTSFTLPETSSNMAFIEYSGSKKNQYIEHSFRLNYKEIGLTCGGELVLDSVITSVTITSPNYPQSPGHELSCEWIIRGPLDQGLLVDINGIKSGWCNQTIAEVKVYKGGSDLAALIKSFCPNSITVPMVVVDSHIVFIRFVLRHVDYRTTFSATVKLDSCHREYFVGYFNDVPFELPAPDYGRNQLTEQNMKCTIRLHTYSPHYIIANITWINLKGNCSYGEMVEFQDTEDSMVTRRYCAPVNANDSIQTSFTSMSNEMFITYQRLGNYQPPSTTENGKPLKTGIKFTTESKYHKCEHTVDAINQVSGTIFSPPPRTTGPHPRYQRCWWRMISEPGTRIKLHFVKFKLGQPLPPNANLSMYECSKRISIFLNLNLAQNMNRIYGCSNEKPPDLYSLDNHILLTYYGLDVVEREGFTVKWKVLYDNESCSSFFDQARGMFVSKHFDNLNYTGPVGCTWWTKMTKTVNQSITLLLDTYDIPPNSLQTFNYFKDNMKNMQYVNTFHINNEMAPQVTGRKFIIPMYIEPAAENTITFSFNRTQAGLYRGMRGEYIVNDCGGVFLQTQGEFTSPNYPNSYQTDTFCNWFFSVDNKASSLQYQITFIDADISENCDEDFFLVESRFDAKIKLCKKDLIDKPIYMHHTLMLSFISSRNLSINSSTSTVLFSRFTSVRKFKFRVEIANHGCGGYLHFVQSHFESPNYADVSDQYSTRQQYPNNVECVWTIRATDDFHLEFMFSSRFDMEESPNCTKDYLLFEEKHVVFGINGQESQQWRPLKRLCGHQNPDTFISQTNLVRVTFRSNDKIVGDGFRVDYRQACGGLFEEETGVITSPQYNEGTYANNLNCVYHIKRSPQEFVRIWFEIFELERYSECQFDWIRIYQGNHTDKNAKTFGPFCSNNLPPPVTVQGEASIVFHTDSFYSQRGFKLHYEVIKCGGNLTDKNGIIVSPPLKESYTSCSWFISVPLGYSVALRIIELDLANEHCRGDCCHSIYIYNGDWRNKKLAFLCTNDHHDLTYQSSNNTMTIIMRRSSLLNNDRTASFKMMYWATPGPQMGCGGSYLGENNGVISSPYIDGHSYYEPNLSCIWAVTSSQESVHDKYIELQFERFDIEAGNGTDVCDADYLDVYDGFSMQAPLLARLCGSLTIPEKIVSSGNSMLLHFVTNDNNITGHGFRARFTGKNRLCGGSVAAFTNESKLILTSPQYPNGYSAPLQCSWSISRSYGRPLVITFIDLDLNCTRGDYLQILEEPLSFYDDRKPGLIRPLTLCSVPTNKMYITRFKVTLVFRSFAVMHTTLGIGSENRKFAKEKSKDKYRGFSLTLHSSLCNESLSGLDNGYVTNMYWPDTYSIYRKFECAINISVPANSQIALYFWAFQMYQCHYSNLTIYEGNSVKAKATYCDMQLPPTPFFSTASNITLLFRASRYTLPSQALAKPNLKVNRIRYGLNYFASPKENGPPGCGGNLTGPEGIFSSPYYPQPLNQQLVCTWLIQSGGYHSMSITFDYFLLSSNCDTIHLDIFDGDEDIDEKKLATFCSNDKPASISSQSNTLMVKLYTTEQNYEAGFLARYKINLQELNLKNRVINADQTNYG